MEQPPLGGGCYHITFYIQVLRSNNFTVFEQIVNRYRKHRYPHSEHRSIRTNPSRVMAERTQMLDARQEEYLNWLLAPAHERTPATQVEFARHVGVDSSTLRRWEKKEFFKKEWERRVNDLQGSPERTQRLLDALYDKALKGDTRAATLYLQATHRLTPAPSSTSASKSMGELSDEELDQLIGKMAEREKHSRQLKAI